MSTVALSKPHCAITSAENPDGIASQAFTTTLPDAHISLILFAIVLPFKSFRHCEQPASKPRPRAIRPCLYRQIPALARNDGALLGCPLDACLADADLAGGVDDCGPGVVRQRNAVFGAISARPALDIAGNHDRFAAGNGLGLAD